MQKNQSAARVKRNVLLLLGVYRSAHYAGIARYAQQAGWILDNLFAQGRVPVWWKGDGMITLIAQSRDLEALAALPKKPLVDLSKGWLLNPLTPAQHRVGRHQPRVLYDNLAIGRMAARHFLERGFRHIAFFNFGNWWMETERLPSFRQTIRDAGAQFYEIPYHRHFSMDTAASAAKEQSALHWLARTIGDLPKPVGIFAAADDLALTVLRACSAARLSVPEEVAVLGCEHEPMLCNFAPVPLSSVDTDLEQQGYAAAELLDRLMDGEPPPREPILIPPKGVVTRQSTDIVAVPHLPVARALRFIWEHYREPIRTPDIAAAIGLSLRGLERVFLKHFQRPMVAELTRCRIEHASKLLLETDLKVQEVAEQSGFSDANYFSNVFCQSVGVRPRTYRRRHLKA